MSKTKSSEKGHYELLFIIANKYTEDEAKEIITKVGTMIKENEGEISFEEYWGKKRLAYAIKHNHYGYYSLYEFDLEGANLAKLEKELRLSSEVLRHQIVKIAKRSAEEIQKEKERKEKMEQKKAEENKDKKGQKSEDRKTKRESADNSASETKEKKADLKDLDDKLEGLLSAKDLL